MKANVQYNDFIGTAAADISDNLGSKYGNHLDSFGKYFNLDGERFKVIGISIFGTDSFQISLMCIDKQRSTKYEEYIVKMSMPLENEKDILDFLFKRLNIVLHYKFDKKYEDLDYDEEVRYSDFHETENEE